MRRTVIESIDGRTWQVTCNENNYSGTIYANLISPNSGTIYTIKLKDTIVDQGKTNLDDAKAAFRALGYIE
jgi:hypothetical protein